MPIDVEDYLCAKSLNPKDYHSPRTCHVRRHLINGGGDDDQQDHSLIRGTADPEWNGTDPRREL